MKKCLFAMLAGLGVSVLAAPAQALTITPTPTDCTLYSCVTGPETAESDIRDIIESLYPDINELYKQNVLGGEEGDLADSYTTTFTNSSSDPEDADIVYDGDEAETASCPTCLLLVKDGNHQPAWYLFDLSSIWDGMETINLRGFWPDQGAISHVSLYGNDSTTVAEPQVLALLGMGLTALVVVRRKARK
ncbi:MAG: hypothetical protein PF589_01710 [Gammaproteobacteria bacterium]|jgi:hypothetical protein|nr:hypothetical protein [Gammaproteobacteria bacterium]